MRNQDIREEINCSGIKYWMIAEKLGISDVTFSRRLRKELPINEKQKISQIILQLKEA
jgi:ribosomal protein L20